MTGLATEPPLAGREAEVRVLGDLLDELDAGSGGLVLEVAGEPGIGKSRLLRELLGEARSRGHVALSGRAAELETGHPFGVICEAFDDWLVGLPRERREALGGGLEAELSVVLAAFDGLSVRRAPELQQERHRSYRAVRLLCSAIAAQAPVVLAIDDVQWADPGSLELLSYLLAHPCRGPVLLAVGLRPAQVPHRLSVALTAALRDPGSRRLDLAALSPAAARDLLGPAIPRSVAERLYRESGGNPFFLLQLARGDALAGRGAAGRVEIGTPVPEAVRAALSSELSALSAQALALLGGAAVTGDPFDLRLAARAAGVGDADVPEAIGELLRFGLVHPVSVVEQFAFRHPIVRSIVYQLAANGWRVRAHARAAAFLAASDAGALTQAPHVERSARRGDLAAVGVLVEAGAASAPRAPALAARWYAAALSLLPRGAAAHGRSVELLIAMATALGADGQLEESRAALCEVLELLPDDHPERVGAVAYCAGVEHLLGRHRDAHARLSAAHRLAAGGSLDAVLLKIELAAGAGYENRCQEMLDWAQQALDGATRLRLPALEVAATGQLALARYFLGLPAGETIDRAGRQLDDLSDEDLAGRLDIGLWVGWTESVLERHDRAVAHCQRVIDVSRATGQGAALLVTMTAQAWSLIRTGRLDDAEEVLTAAIETGRLAPNLFLSVAVGLSALLATQRGELDAALRAGEESVRLARSADPGLIPGMSGLYLAIPLIELGEARRAREIILEMSGGNELRTSRSGHTAAYEILTRAELALGRPQAAETWAAAAQAATHGDQLAVEAAFAHRARTAVLLAAGTDAAGAAQVALQAADRAQAAGAPVEAGRCRIIAARALVSAGRRTEAVAELEGALDGLARVGAAGYQAQAERALRRLGRRTARRRGPATGEGNRLESLTDGEREVAVLIRRGHTNREIAAAIFVSEKTVERYVTRIFAKLGVSRRAELAARLAAETGPLP
ncbi:MAG TPA: AAA family ATPase [Solirubrobacteraceae bacterium]|nr:AAA family ATPase [Solirubrobacteraceae bacterium]